jgi:ribosomal protein S6--L-glutamate ligase
MIDVPDLLADYTRKAMAHLGADVLGLDFLQTRHGDYVLLESNDIPGLAGFPDAVKHAIADQMRAKLSG